MKDNKVLTILRQISLNQTLSEDEKNDLRYILAHILGTEKARLILLTEQELTPGELQTWNLAKDSLLLEKLPVHYIINTKNFMGLDFFVDERVLIPRFDTEVLVEETLKEISRLKIKETISPLKILELCTGSGAIPISIIHHTKDIPRLQIKALDISQPALEVAEINKEKLLSSLEQERLSFIQSDLFENVQLPTSPEEAYSLIVANPPYVAQEEYDTLEDKVKREPVNALVAENQGLFFYEKILSEAKGYLHPRGSIIFEIGSLQGTALEKLAKDKGYLECTIIPDYAGNSRVAVIR